MLSLQTRGPPLSPCSGGERTKVVLGGPCQHYGWLLLSHSTCQSCIHCTERLCSGAGAYRALSGRGWWVRTAGLSLSSLHSDPGCAGDGCSAIGIGTRGLPRAPDGLSGQSARPLGQGGLWTRTCSWGRGGEPQQRWGPSRERATCQAKHAPGYVWAVVRGLPVLLGVDAQHAPTWQVSMPPCG